MPVKNEKIINAMEVQQFNSCRELGAFDGARELFRPSEVACGLATTAGGAAVVLLFGLLSTVEFVTL